MAGSKDLYRILEVDRNADEKTIKNSYRKLVKKYHPDANPGDKTAESKFKDVSEAYAILGDPKKKKIYDKYGYEAFSSGMNPEEYAKRMDEATKGGFGGFGTNGGFEGFTRSGGTNNGNGSYTYHFTSNGNGQDFSDMFGDIFGDMFRGSGNRSSGRGGRSRFYSQNFGSDAGSGFGREQDVDLNVHSNINVSFEDAAFGCDKTIRLSSPDGSGKEQTLRVHIPAGIDEGESVRLRGKGNTMGGRTGDLLLKVHIMSKDGFERKGMDVYTKAEVPFTTAALGGEARFHTLTGDVTCHVPAGTRDGGKIRLRGKGIVSMKDPNVHGDQYVEIRIEVPQNLSAQEKQKLREFEELRRSGSGRRGSVA